MTANPAIFAAACDPAYRPALHHAYLAGVIAGKLARGGARLIVNLPPRHGKSRLFAVETPLWAMTREPARGARRGLEVVVASYTVDLALRHAREARQRLSNPIFQSLTPARQKRGHSAAADWELTNGATYKAVGVGGSLTGHGADLLILDDLHKDAAESHSPILRQRVWDWLQSVALTRLSPGASVILIGTRWHQDDVSGRLLARERGAWQGVNLPALAGVDDELGRQPGEPLWPERFPLEALNDIRAAVSNYFWAALYDGNPVADSGNHIDIERLEIVDPADVPSDLRRVRFWDLAVTATTAADCTAGALCGRDAAGNFWVLDVRRGHWEWTAARELICARAREDRCQVGVEAAGTQKGLLQNLREVFPPDIALAGHMPERDKLTRALPWFARANSGQVRLARGAWNAAFLDECQAFPLGAHDDQVDAVSGAHALLFGPLVPSPTVLRAGRVPEALAARRQRSVTV